MTAERRFAVNLKDRMIMDDYRRQRQDFVRLGDLASSALKQELEGAKIDTLAVEHRVKQEESLAGKLERKSDKYSTLEDITDILGIRVICFFGDDVDRAGKLIEDVFVVDWENSVDKRALIRANSFGYLSLHYICSLPEGLKYPPELCGRRFEIQVRTTLQHTWACIEHDMGYKGEFGIPRVAVRQFARIAGLLELADDEFVRVRDTVHAYTRDIKQEIMDDDADDVLIDSVSLREYVLRNKKRRKLRDELAAICGSEIREISPDNYLEQLRWLGKKNLGDMEQLLEENHDLALALAKKALENTDLDILSSSVGLRFLCRAELLNKQYSEEQVTEILVLSVGDRSRASRMAKSLLKTTFEK
jgi:ppGpp synthetase/RelA/SpoT-type nucleotidyltranferase